MNAQYIQWARRAIEDARRFKLYAHECQLDHTREYWWNEALFCLARARKWLSLCGQAI